MRYRTRDIVVILFALCVALVRYFYFLPEPTSVFYDAVGKEVSFSGFVDDYPDKRQNQIRLTIRPDNLDWNILVPIYNPEEDFRYGDVLRVSGLLTLPESFETDTGREFDYGKYLFADNIFFIIKNPEVEKVGKGGNKIKQTLFNIREKFERSLYDIFPVRDAGFIDGLILGTKGGINNSDKDAFVKTGTIHIVALSGFNVMIVAEAILRLVSLFAYGMLAYFSAGLVVVLFVILAGAGATAVRAGVMAVIALIARSTGRTYKALRALVIASLLMLVINPRIVFDVSFHLSVLATFGVIVLPPKLLKYFMWIPSFYGFRQMVLTTLAASIAVIPYIMYVMGSISVVSLFANIMILPVISILMFLGFLSGLFGLFLKPFALVFAFLGHVGNEYLFGVVHFFSNLPFASFNVKKFPLILLIFFYTWLLWWVFFQKKNSQ